MSDGPEATILALLMLAAGILIFGGIRLIRCGERGKGMLMILCAIVMVGNVAIWTV